MGTSSAAPWTAAIARGRHRMAKAAFHAGLACVMLQGCSDPKVDARRKAAGQNPSPAALMRVADAERGGRLFGQCAGCHTIGQGAPDRNGPNLFGIVGKPIAGASALRLYRCAEGETRPLGCGNPVRMAEGSATLRTWHAHDVFGHPRPAGSRRRRCFPEERGGTLNLPLSG
ncbi:hypothetical protein [uncultured Sphingomonas sp.]|uniref:c-type cytochrome n=1 Tax=uncultured Sphingomonas sp. TaxID=158754 RepID=UPI00344F005F